jgi:ABC-type spermidine/putrescine transport system permease subunit II
MTLVTPEIVFGIAALIFFALPIYIFSQLRFGVSPEINATAAMILGLTLAAIVVAYLILRRTSQTREPTALGV